MNILSSRRVDVAPVLLAARAAYTIAFRVAVTAVATVATSFGAATAVAQTAPFPTQPVTLVVPFGPGGIADLTARAVGEAMAVSLGQAVVIENKPSAGSIVASQQVARARPDGHTLLLMSNSNAVSVSLFRKLPFETRRDFAPVGIIGFFDLGVFVASTATFKSLPELVADARARPGKLTVGSIAIGSTQHLAAELFKTSAGVDVLVVPYKGSPALLAALRGGEIDVAFEILGPMTAQVQAGTVRALAVTGARRHASLPAVPTVQESAVAGYSVASWNALAAPAGTPAAVISRLNGALRQALETPSVRERLGRIGVDPQAGRPEDLGSLLDAEIRKWGAVISAAKIELQ